MEEKSKSKNNTNNTLNNHSKNLNKFNKNTILYTDLAFTPKLLKKSMIEFDLEKMFTIETKEIFYKNSLFYEKARIILEPTRILSYTLSETKGKNKLLFVLDFNHLTMEIAVKKRQKKFRILILGSEKVFRFKTFNYELYERFLMYINYFLSNSQEKNCNLLFVSLLPNFYKVIALLLRVSISMKELSLIKLNLEISYYLKASISSQLFIG